MLLPIGTDTSVRRTPVVNYALIGLNVLIYLLLGGVESPRPFARGWLGLLQLNGADPQLFQFFSYQFLHANIMHIGGNMLFLWVFGNPVNSKMGHGPYAMFYLAGGVFAATGYGYFTDVSMVGASGAIAAVTTAYLALFPRSHITLLYWWFFIGTFELPSMIMIVLKMILWDNVLAPGIVGAGNVAHGAHMAGYLFGFFAAAGMLVLRVLPRDQFDIVALWRRWLQRSGLRTRLENPEERARAQFGRVARPVSATDLGDAVMTPARLDRVTDLRMQIAESMARQDLESAALLYEKLLEVDARQVLSRNQQLDIANQLLTMNRYPQAAAAYEKYLSQYASGPDAVHVKLLLGIIYARDLQQYEVAEAHLLGTLDRLNDEKRREQALHWLNVAGTALGRPPAQA